MPAQIGNQHPNEIPSALLKLTKQITRRIVDAPQRHCPVRDPIRVGVYSTCSAALPVSAAGSERDRRTQLPTAAVRAAEVPDDIRSRSNSAQNTCPWERRVRPSPAAMPDPETALQYSHCQAGLIRKHSPLSPACAHQPQHCENGSNRRSFLNHPHWDSVWYAGAPAVGFADVLNYHQSIKSGIDGAAVPSALITTRKPPSPEPSLTSLLGLGAIVRRRNQKNATREGSCRISADRIGLLRNHTARPHQRHRQSGKRQIRERCNQLAFQSRSCS